MADEHTGTAYSRRIDPMDEKLSLACRCASRLSAYLGPVMRRVKGSKMMMSKSHSSLKALVLDSNGLEKRIIELRARSQQCWRAPSGVGAGEGPSRP